MQLYGYQQARKTTEKKSVLFEARRRHKDRPLIDEERAAAAVITHDARRARFARSACRKRPGQPSHDVIFLGDDASHLVFGIWYLLLYSHDGNNLPIRRVS